MKERRILIGVSVSALLLLAAATGLAYAQGAGPPAPSVPQGILGTAFTYQGQLKVDGQPVDGECEMAFRLYNQADGGSQVGEPITQTVTVHQGLFTVSLDFGNAFSGLERWLGVWVMCAELGDTEFADLGRQALTATPYALYSRSTGALQGRLVDTTLPLAGQVLEWDGSLWTPSTDDAGADYANVVVVAQSGGDYTSVQEAIDSINDATADNPYLVWIAPGVYEEQVVMRPYVHLQGAGQEATIITSTATSAISPPTEATLVLAHSTSLRDLTVGNSGTGVINTALLATNGTTQTLVADVTARAQGTNNNINFAIFVTGSDTDVALLDVTALAEHSTFQNRGLYNYNGSRVVLRGGSFTARGGSVTYGIHNFGSNAELEASNATATGENGSVDNHGLYNTNSAKATLLGGSFTARGGGNARAILNETSSATLEAHSITALGENGSNNYGLYQTHGTVRLAVSQLDGGAYRSGGTLTCFQVYDGAYNGYTCP